MHLPQAIFFGCILAVGCGGKTDTPTAGSAGSATTGALGSSAQSSTSTTSGGVSGVGGAGFGGNGGAGGDVNPGSSGGGGGSLGDVPSSCSINSDCKDPLVCVFKRCHFECLSTRDCPVGVRCVEVRDVDTGVLVGDVCQLLEERACTNNGQCPGMQVCGIDGQCRDLCDADRDCIGEQLCRAHTCADPSELNAEGTLNQVIDGGTKPDGAPLREPDAG